MILILSGCYRPPEFSEVPRISFAKLQLTDTATLVLEFNVRDGDGDIGLQSDSDDQRDSFEPYHPYSVVVDRETVALTFGETNSTNGPFEAIPAAVFSYSDRLLLVRYDPEDTSQYIEEKSGIFSDLFRVGEPYSFSDEDPRDEFYRCEDYEVISIDIIQTDSIKVVQEFERTVGGETIKYDSTVIYFDQEIVKTLDTVFVVRNEFNFNVFIDLQVKQGDNYVSYGFPDQCGLGYNARMPVFKQGLIGRPVEGSIEYALFSLVLESQTNAILTDVVRLRFYIYDRALNQSNVVTTPDFRILDLRQSPLIGEGN